MSIFATTFSRPFKCHAFSLTTKSLIQKLRDDGWEPLLASVISFCEQHEIDIPDMMLFFWEPFLFFSFFLFLGIELAQMKLDELVEDVMNLDINKKSG